MLFRSTNPNIQIEPIRLKGRGSRFGEDFYENLEEAVNDIFMNIKNKIIDNEYAIFGYSMGSLLAYELYYFPFLAEVKVFIILTTSI